MYIRLDTLYTLLYSVHMENTATQTGTKAHTFIARHVRRQIERSGCTRKALRFEANFHQGRVECPDCHEPMTKIDTITAGTASDASECNARCMGATTGGVCECRCKGENHGGRWS